MHVFNILQYIRLLLSLAMFFVSYSTDHNLVVPYFAIRSQATDSARQLVGWAQKIHLFDMEKIYGVFGITPEITVSFQPKQIIRCLLPVNKSYTTVLRGSNAPNRGTTDWLADYFGLPPDYHSVVTLKPHITTLLLDLSLFLGLDEWKEGWYISMNSPLVYTKWHLNTHEHIHNRGIQSYKAGYFSIIPVNRNALFYSFHEYITGQELTTSFNGQEMYNALCYARWADNPLIQHGVAAINVIIGNNSILEEDYHLGLNSRLGIPTGTRPKGLFLFEPIIGNGHHWEVGLGLTGHYTIWRSIDYEKDVSLYLDANLTHLFTTSQCRTFDICNKPASRYMLAHKMGTPVINLQALLSTENTLQPDAQFKNAYTPVANLTTIPVNVTIPVQLDLSLMLNITCDSIAFDIGYNVWCRSCEQITLNNNTHLPLGYNANWALKGDSYMYGFTNNTTAVALSATQSHATLFTGSNAPAHCPLTNCAVDKPHEAQTDEGSRICSTPCTPEELAIKTSLQPVLLQYGDIDVCKAQTNALTNALFFHFSYTKRYRDDWLPYFGIGSKIEFASIRKGDNTQSQDCNKCALSQYELWIKAGLGFR